MWWSTPNWLDGHQGCRQLSTSRPYSCFELVFWKFYLQTYMRQPSPRGISAVLVDFPGRTVRVCSLSRGDWHHQAADGTTSSDWANREGKSAKLKAPKKDRESANAKGFLPEAWKRKRKDQKRRMPSSSVHKEWYELCYGMPIWAQFRPPPPFLLFIFINPASWVLLADNCVVFKF